MKRTMEKRLLSIAISISLIFGSMLSAPMQASAATVNFRTNMLVMKRQYMASVLGGTIVRHMQKVYLMAMQVIQ